MKIINNYPLSRVTTLEIGGPAKKFVSAKTEDELIGSIKFAKENGLEFLIIGGGSNLLVSDEGVDKLVIKNAISGIEMHTPGVSPKVLPGSHPGGGTMLKVKSGTLLQDLVDFTISNGLSGLQKLTGIPGTVGGAVYGAAGAYGQEIIDHLTHIVILSPVIEYGVNSAKNLITLSKDECGFGYRDSSFKKNGLIILEITFQLDKGNPEELKKEAEEILNKRLLKYPKGIKCPGSFFKNILADTLPEDILSSVREKIIYGKLSAGVLLEEVGAKGDSLDGIAIASYHANLFINKGGGKAKDFYALAKKYWEKVYQKFGIRLEPEVQLINLPPPQ